MSDPPRRPSEIIVANDKIVDPMTASHTPSPVTFSTSPSLVHTLSRGLVEAFLSDIWLTLTRVPSLSPPSLPSLTSLESTVANRDCDCTQSQERPLSLSAMTRPPRPEDQSSSLQHLPRIQSRSQRQTPAALIPRDRERECLRNSDEEALRQ
jgi:hypothetical protein